MLTSKTKRDVKGKGEKNLILVSVNVVGSAGLIRFIVDEDDLVVDVARKALKIYGREERLPFLGFDATEFMILCPTADSDLLNQLDRIGSSGARNFLMCKKPQLKTDAEDLKRDTENAGKGTGALKSWIQFKY